MRNTRQANNALHVLEVGFDSMGSAVPAIEGFLQTHQVVLRLGNVARKTHQANQNKDKVRKLLKELMAGEVWRETCDTSYNESVLKVLHSLNSKKGKG